MISVVHSPITQQKFVILDAPTQNTLPNYIATFEKENVSDLVRICNRPSADDPAGGRDSYDAKLLEHETGIRVIDDIKFQDGGVPSPGTIQRWLDLTDKARESGTTVAVHCVAGIGRAPVCFVHESMTSWLTVRIGPGHTVLGRRRDGSSGRL